MSEFFESTLESKLEDLNTSQQSIQTLSLWLIHHRKYAKKIVAMWKKVLTSVSQPKKLTFLYLANDIIQNSKKKSPKFSQEFAEVLQSAFHHVLKEADGKTKAPRHKIGKKWD
jgi:regulator of Ty1 transposition protein 103